MEWLIDALCCADLGLRTEAHRELKAAAGDDFGYRPDSDKRSRRRSLEAWQQWKRKVKAGSEAAAAFLPPKARGTHCHRLTVADGFRPVCAEFLLPKQDELRFV